MLGFDVFTKGLVQDLAKHKNIVFCIIISQSILGLFDKLKINKLLENRYPTHFWISIRAPLLPNNFRRNRPFRIGYRFTGRFIECK